MVVVREDGVAQDEAKLPGPRCQNAGHQATKNDGAGEGKLGGRGIEGTRGQPGWRGHLIYASDEIPQGLPDALQPPNIELQLATFPNGALPTNASF